MRMLAYIRRSTVSDDRTVSLHAQREAIADYAEAHDLIANIEMVDDGVSGGDRRRYDRMRECIVRNELSGMISYNLDRVARDVSGQLDLLKWFHISRLELHTTDQGIIRSEQSSDFISVGVQSLLNEYQRKRAQEHGVSTFKRKESNMERYSRFAPYGFQFKDEHGRIIPYPPETSTYERIKKMTEDGYGPRAIVIHLTERGIKNRLGHVFSRGSIAGIQKRIVRGY